MQPAERQLVLDQLASSEARLLDLTRGLTPDQWHFRETPERWSIAENIEHVAILEDYLLETIARTLETPPAPEKRTQAAAKESLVHRIGTVRSVKINARGAALPTGRWADTDELIARFRQSRAATLAFAAGTEADLRDHFFPHMAFGEIDCYQWLLVMAQHGARHALQIEDIKAHPGYPAS